MVSFPGASAPLSVNIISSRATRVKPQTRFPWKKPLPGAWASAHSPLGRQIPRPTREPPEKTSPGNGVKGPRAFFAPFLLSPHASRTPGILSLLQKPSPGAAPFPLRRLGWMTRGTRCARRGKRPPGGASATGKALILCLPPHSRSQLKKPLPPLPARARSEWRRGTRVTGAAARSPRPHALHERKGQRKIERVYIQPYAYVYACTRAPACSNEKENYLKITCCSLR